MPTLPSLFVSHGAPTFALDPGRAGENLRRLGMRLGRPEAILIVSPHWITSGVEITSGAHPETLHDFGGFPRALYDLRYPAPGSPALAERVCRLLLEKGVTVRANTARGFDHGVWTPLMHLFPGADIPVVQLSLPAGIDDRGALTLGRFLSSLSDEGVLFIGSGSLTHNLRDVQMGEIRSPAYVREFSEWVRAAVEACDTERLANAMTLAPHADRAHPTTEHFLPLLTALGAAANPWPALALDGGILHGGLCMDSYVFAASHLSPLR